MWRRAYWCIQALTMAMLALACYLPDTLNYPKAELLKREAVAGAALGNGRSLGMTPLAAAKQQAGATENQPATLHYPGHDKEEAV